MIINKCILLQGARKCDRFWFIHILLCRFKPISSQLKTVLDFRLVKDSLRAIKDLQLRLWNLNSTSNSSVAARRLSCQISANQRETKRARISTNVERLKTLTPNKGSRLDVTTYRRENHFPFRLLKIKATLNHPAQNCLLRRRSKRSV